MERSLHVAPRPRFHRRILPGIVLHGTQLWLSELLAVALVLAMIALVAALGVRIARNSVTIESQMKQLSFLEREDIDIRNRLDSLRSQERLVRALRTSVSRRTPDSTVIRLAGLVSRSSRQYGYDPLLVLAVIRVESRYDPRAIGRFRSGKESGAVGLMQLMLETAQITGRDIGVRITSTEDLFRPEINIPLGIAYLTKMIGQFRSFKLALLAYNQGPGAVMSDLRAKRPLSIGYYEKVLKEYEKLRVAAE